MNFIYVFLAFIAAATMTVPVSAQTVKLLNSTGLMWSGGIAGRHGTNYNFSVEFSGHGQNEPVPDTIWIGNEPKPITLKTIDNKPFNCTKKVSKKKTVYDISVGISRDDMRDMYPPPYGKKNETQPQPPVKYTGTALLSYTYKGRQRYFVINKIMTWYPPVNYP